jgi:predicted O-methyltransferase YrrM
MRTGEGARVTSFDVAIVCYNTDAYLHGLLASLRDVLPQDRLGEVHVWDNGSSDATRAMASAFTNVAPWLRVHRSDVNVQHGPALDALLRSHCTAEWVLVLDADTEVLRDFVPSLPCWAGEPPAFIGQIHPQMPHLYAYLAHLLIHRPTYLALPPFRDDGAPGDELFRAIDARRLPYARFRWRDYVSHAGQASLRALHARGETAHPLYAFAAEQARVRPVSSDRASHEERLRARLTAFLDSRRSPEASLQPLPDGTADLQPSRVRREGVARRRASAGAMLRAGFDAVRDPHAARALHRATRIGLAQRIPEIRALFTRVRRLRPRRVLEIGTAYGGSLYLWTRAAAPDARLISVDLPPWELDDPAEAGKRLQLQSLARASQSIEVIRGDSHDPKTLAAACAALAGAPLDFLFVDGDPTIGGTRRDVADYGALLAPGGLMAHRDDTGLRIIMATPPDGVREPRPSRGPRRTSCSCSSRAPSGTRGGPEDGR